MELKKAVPMMENKKMKKSKTVQSPNKLPELFDLFAEWNKSPIHNSAIIRESSEIVLSQLLNLYNNFPNQMRTDPISMFFSKYF